MFPEAVHMDIAVGFVSEGVGWVCSGQNGLGGVVSIGVQSILIEDGRFDHNSQVGESNASEVGSFIVRVIVVDAD